MKKSKSNTWSMLARLGTPAERRAKAKAFLELGWSEQAVADTMCLPLGYIWSISIERRPMRSSPASRASEALLTLVQQQPKAITRERVMAILRAHHVNSHAEQQEAVAWLKWRIGHLALTHGVAITAGDAHAPPHVESPGTPQTESHHG